jgi:hypothetical protein
MLLLVAVGAFIASCGGSKANVEKKRRRKRATGASRSRRRGDQTRSAALLRSHGSLAATSKRRGAADFGQGVAVGVDIGSR